MSEEIDIEEDGMTHAWAVAPSGACWFSALAIFRIKKHAQEYADRINESKRLKGAYGDCVVVPATADVVCANTFDAKAGRRVLVAQAALRLIDGAASAGPRKGRSGRSGRGKRG